MSNRPIRSGLTPRLEKAKPVLVKVFDQLKSQSSSKWYPSLMLESRLSRQFTAHSRSESTNEKLSEGLILRIFDGVSLFEEASHDFSEASALQLVSRLVSRVRDQQMDRGEEKPIQYWPPSWKQRLAAKLEPEIWEQIPRGVDAKTWVHFGTPQVHELWKANNEISAFTKENFNRLKDLGGEIGDENPAREPDFIQVKVNLDKSDYIFIDDETRMSQSLLRNSMSLVLMKKGERAFSVQGGLGGKESLEVDDLFIAEVYDKLRKCLVAEKIKPGRYKILMSPSITGVFAHEAFGHSQEGDTWARGRSKARELYESKERVGNDHATIYNNPAIYRNGDEIFPAWGSYYFDEEGWLAQEHCLVKKGVLQEPMTNLVSALRLGVPRTANGKREDWTHGLYVRQTNTYFSAGDKTLKELISMVDYGFLAHVAYGGMEDPKGMGIQVGMAFVEEIVNGQLTGKIFKGPNGGAIQMTGYVPEYLNSIIAKSKIEAHHGEVDESQHPWNEVGGCGKYHKEYVVAGCGGPYMLVDNVLLS